MKHIFKSEHLADNLVNGWLGLLPVRETTLSEEGDGGVGLNPPYFPYSPPVSPPLHKHFMKKDRSGFILRKIFFTPFLN